MPARIGQRKDPAVGGERQQHRDIASMQAALCHRTTVAGLPQVFVSTETLPRASEHVPTLPRQNLC
jgi:hypothetical protein